MTATRTTSQRKPAAVHGIARWVRRPDANGRGTIFIRRDGGRDPGRVYDLVLRTCDGARVACLAYQDGGRVEVYTVEIDAGTCQCRDHCERHRPCKHLLGLRAALAALEQPARKPEPAGCTCCHHHASTRRPCVRPECQGF